MTLSEFATEILKVIPSEKYWCKGHTEMWGNGVLQHCLGGAAGVAARAHGLKECEFADIYARLGEATVRDRTIVGYNDDPATTYADIRRLLEQLIKPIEPIEDTPGEETQDEVQHQSDRELVGQGV